MDTELVTEVLQIDEIGLVNGLGGSIGLFLGYSCVTFLEGIIILFQKIFKRN